MTKKLILFSVLILFSQYLSARDIRDTQRNRCLFNGKKLSPAATKETKNITRSVANDFSGHVICFMKRMQKIDISFYLYKGKRHGIFKKYNPVNGKVSKEGQYKDGKYHGVTKKYDYRNNNLQSQLNYKDGKLWGIQRKYHSNNNMLKRIMWVGTQLKGSRATSIQFNKYGHPTSITCGPVSIIPEDIKWCGRNGKRGRIKLYSSKDKINRIQEYLNFKMDGRHITLDREGKIKRINTYKNGSKIQSKYFEKNKLINISQFKDKKMEGSSISYFPDTKFKQSQYLWKNGLLIKERKYHLNGVLYYYARYESDGKAIVRTYHNNGKLKSSINYKKSNIRTYLIRHGSYKYYARNEALTEKGQYENDRPIGSFQFYYPSGELYREERYLKGNIMTSINYDKYGVQIRIEQYNSDGSIRPDLKGKINI